MSSSPGLILRCVAALALVVLVAYSAWGRAPRRAAAPRDLRRLVAAAVALYAVGVLAVLSHRPVPAIAAFGGGVGAASLAAWLSRGADPDGGDDHGGGGGGRPPLDRTPPPDRGGTPVTDWTRFDRERERWSRSPHPGARPPAQV